MNDSLSKETYLSSLAMILSLVLVAIISVFPVFSTNHIYSYSLF